MSSLESYQRLKEYQSFKVQLDGELENQKKIIELQRQIEEVRKQNLELSEQNYELNLQSKEIRQNIDRTLQERTNLCIFPGD